MAVHLRVPLKADVGGKNLVAASKGDKGRKGCFKQTDSGSYEQRLVHFELEGMRGLLVDILKRSDDDDESADGVTVSIPATGVCC